VKRLSFRTERLEGAELDAVYEIEIMRRVVEPDSAAIWLAWLTRGLCSVRVLTVTLQDSAAASSLAALATRDEGLPRIPGATSQRSIDAAAPPWEGI
jgi:hypothetical protein